MVGRVEAYMCVTEGELGQLGLGSRERGNISLS